jgi:methyltransferase-like protein
MEYYKIEDIRLEKEKIDNALPEYKCHRNYIESPLKEEDFVDVVATTMYQMYPRVINQQMCIEFGKKISDESLDPREELIKALQNNKMIDVSDFKEEDLKGFIRTVVVYSLRFVHNEGDKKQIKESIKTKLLKQLVVKESKPTQLTPSTTVKPKVTDIESIACAGQAAGGHIDPKKVECYIKYWLNKFLP